MSGTKLTTTTAGARTEDAATPPVFRGIAPAVFVSAALHGFVLLALSLIVLSTVADINPVVTVLFDPGAGDQPAFLETAEITAATVSVEESATVPETSPITLPESELNISDSLFPVSTGEAPSKTSAESGSAVSSAAGTSDGSQADPTKAAMIQERVGREGGAKGEVQFSLAWTNVNDIDLHIIAPSGERISHGHRQSECHGALDVDMNVDGESEEPVENIRWLPKRAPVGRYTVLINLFKVHGRSDRTDYQLLVNLGTESEIVEDAVSGRTNVAVHRFQYVPQSFSDARRQVLFEQMDRKQESEEERARAMLDRIVDMEKGKDKDVKLFEIVNRYPHTDAAVEALKLMSNTVSKG